MNNEGMLTFISEEIDLSDFVKDNVVENMYLEHCLIKGGGKNYAYYTVRQGKSLYEIEHLVGTKKIFFNSNDFPEKNKFNYRVFQESIPNDCIIIKDTTILNCDFEDGNFYLETPDYEPIEIRNLYLEKQDASQG